MRILLLATYFPKPGNALIGTWALDQAQAFQRAGAQVRVISLTPWIPRWPAQRASLSAYSTCPSEAQWDEVRAHYPRWLLYPVTAVERWYAANPAPWLQLAWRFCRRDVLQIAADFAPDVIFAHHTCVNGWIALQLAEALRRPFFCQDHALWDIEMCDRYPKRRAMFTQIARRASGMFAVSRRMATDILRVAPQARVTVLPNGAKLSAVTQKPKAMHERPPVIFSAGMFVRYKGFDVLLQAWKLVQEQFPTARLRIAGDGPDRALLHELQRRLGLERSVEFLGYLPQAKVQEEMAQARAFALASWHETFGVVFMEAAAVGTPSIWVKNAGVGDVFVDGAHGIAVEPHDPAGIASAIGRLLTSPRDAEKMGNACRDFVTREFTWDAIARQGISQFNATPLATTSASPA